MDAFKTARNFLGNDIPEVQGLYYFRPGLFRKSALGLRGNSNYSNEELQSAKRILEKNISRLANLYSDRSLMGSIKEENKNSNNALKLSLVGTLELRPQLEKVKETLSRTRLSTSMFDCIEQLEAGLPPIYVGITREQGLRNRYNQHKSDFYNRCPSTFGGRASKHFLQWSHLSFYAVEFPTSKVNENYLELFEDLMHISSQPILSLR